MCVASFPNSMLLIVISVYEKHAKMLFGRSERNKIAVIVTCCEKRY